MVKYMFYIEVENGAGGIDVIEWTGLTKHTAVIMYNATTKNCHYLHNPLHGYGWRVQE